MVTFFQADHSSSVFFRTELFYTIAKNTKRYNYFTVWERKLSVALFIEARNENSGVKQNMATFIVVTGKCIVLCICIAIVTGTTTVTSVSNGVVSEPLNISCIVDPQNSAVTIKLPDGISDVLSCSAPLPNTICSSIMPYTFAYVKDGTKVTFVLTIHSLNISIHNGTWTCTHGLESSTGEVTVYAPLFPQGKEPTVTATSAANLITVSGDAYCQHPVSSVSFEVLYAEQNGGFAMLNPQPNISRQYLGSNGCGSDEINVKFSGTASCDKYGSLAGKKFSLMGRFNQPNLPPDINTYNVTKGSFSCPDGSDNDSELSEGAIAGIVIAVVVVCGVVVCVILIVIFKKKKNKARKEQLEKKDSRRTEAQNGEESHNLRNSQQPT